MGPVPLGQPRHRPDARPLLSRFRYRIDTAYGQVVDRYRAERVWARDPWHLWGRLLRKLLSHTLAVRLSVEAEEAE